VNSINRAVRISATILGARVYRGTLILWSDR